MYAIKSDSRETAECPLLCLYLQWDCFRCTQWILVPGIFFLSFQVVHCKLHEFPFRLCAVTVLYYSYSTAHTQEKLSLVFQLSDTNTTCVSMQCTICNLSKSWTWIKQVRSRLMTILPYWFQLKFAELAVIQYQAWRVPFKYTFSADIPISGVV